MTGGAFGGTLFKINTITRRHPARPTCSSSPTIRHCCPADGARRADGDPVGRGRDVHRAGSGNAPQTCPVATLRHLVPADDRHARRRSVLPARARPAEPKTFGKQPHLLSGIRGPLAVEGGTTAADRSIHGAVLLPGEDNAPPFNVAAQPPEWQQIDTLNVYDDGSVEDLTGNAHLDRADRPEHGPATSTSPASAAAPCPFNEPGKYPGGISYGSVRIDPVTHVFTTDGTLSTVEVVNVMLGQGNDQLSIASTLQPGGDFNPITGLRGELAHHGGITAVHGGGNQPLKVDGRSRSRRPRPTRSARRTS